MLSKLPRQLNFEVLLCLSFLWGHGQAFTAKPSQGGNPTTILSVTSESTEAPAIAEKFEAILRSVTEEHEEEVLAGFQSFQTTTKDDDQVSVWTDDDFISRSVGVGYAGPDEQILSRGDEVFQTVAPVFSKEECETIVAEARKIITEGLEREKKNNEQNEDEFARTNSQLGEARVSTMPQTNEWLTNAMRDKLLPLLESRFGSGDDSNPIRADELTLHDALVIGYGYFGCPTKSQPIHRDTSIISLNVALSPSTDYVGGGTYFDGFDGTAIQNEQGHVLCHAGGAMHAGYSIEQGERWVLVLFILAKDAPQLARRCHARGVRALQRGDIDEAESALKAGLTVSPDDHLLHKDLGRVYMAQEKRELAKIEFEKTNEAYPLCQKTLIGLGSMLLEEGKLNEAYEKFDFALERLQNKDLKEEACMQLRADGYNARFNAAYCALRCADKEAADDADRKSSRTFGLKQLPRTIERLRICIDAAPGNGQLHGMLSHAIKLLDEAERIETP
eukprot:CAMPEP_0195289724 /NCGR_PEP_ID=MMETSP0707-20130614/5881_1 /TAXON_ID=33640 /ORGANISM="Asterionellopsis glacialis, Strain CCMP134" /LENGTH=503 /DNA_ID=CAMNT_0040349757 /DNA_START=72 /DNA_END=1583 /DNA_ORIENTATION=-